MLIHPSVASRRYRSACPDSVFTFSGIHNDNTYHNNQQSIGADPQCFYEAEPHPKKNDSEPQDLIDGKSCSLPARS